jgi:hypothetical protein
MKSFQPLRETVMRLVAPHFVELEAGIGKPGSARQCYYLYVESAIN